jgi:hypothetical protein
MNAPDRSSSALRPAAIHMRAKMHSSSLANHAASVYAVAGSVTRSTRDEVVLMPVS